MRVYPQKAAKYRQRGSSAIEFTLVAIPILLVGLGGIELSRWFFIKQAISLALLEAGRAGVTDHARPASIETAFERGLLPLFPPTAEHTSTQRLRRALAARQAISGTAPWQIHIMGPTSEIFMDFASPDLKVAGALGLAAINNHYQAEQHERYVQQGFPNGQGPLSGATIFEANHLVLHLTYMHEPAVPGMRALLRLLSTGTAGYRQQALASGYLPLQQTLRLTMQSHPVAWASSNPKVVYIPHEPSVPSATQPAQAGACQGIWCTTFNPVNTSSEAPDTGATPHLPMPGQPPQGPPSSGPAMPSPGALPMGSEGDSLPGPGDMACGTLICCI